MGFEHILVERSGAFGHRHDEPATAAQCAAPAAHARATTRINLVGLGLSKPSVDPAPRGCSQDGRMTDGSSGGRSLGQSSVQLPAE
jgi:hypothetical protein